MGSQLQKNSAREDLGSGSADSKASPGGKEYLHYLVGGVTLSLVLLVFYAFFFEDQAPPYLLGQELEEPQRLEISGERPVLVIEDVDFGEEPSLTEGSFPEETTVARGEDGGIPLEKPSPETQEAEPAKLSVPDPEEPLSVEVPADTGADRATTDEERPEKTQAPTEAEAEALAVAEGDFVVQIIASRSDKTAKKIADEARAEGLPSYVEKLEREGQTLHRVRVGPFDSRGAAELAKRDLHKIGYKDSVIIDLR